MIYLDDLDQLEKEREKASQDKADLFDFYHDNWDELIKEFKELIIAYEIADRI